MSSTTTRFWVPLQLSLKFVRCCRLQWKLRGHFDSALVISSAGHFFSEFVRLQKFQLAHCLVIAFTKYFRRENLKQLSLLQLTWWKMVFLGNLFAVVHITLFTIIWFFSGVRFSLTKLFDRSYSQIFSSAHPFKKNNVWSIQFFSKAEVRRGSSSPNIFPQQIFGSIFF